MKCYYCDELFVDGTHVCRVTGVTFEAPPTVKVEIDRSKPVLANGQILVNVEIGEEADIPPADAPLSAYGELGKALRADPSFYRPLVPAPMKSKSYSIPFFHHGRKGELATVQVTPGILFRAYTATGTDDSKVLRPGYNTKIKEVFVGNRAQISRHRHGDDGLLTHQFPDFVLQHKLDTYQQTLPITFQVLFLEDCLWTVELHGKAAF